MEIAGGMDIADAPGQDIQTNVEVVAGVLLGGADNWAENLKIASGGRDKLSVCCVAGGFDPGGANIKPDKNALSGQYGPQSSEVRESAECL